MSRYTYIVVGGGIAGLSAVRAIRERDGSGEIALINGEDRIPYKRTKISKNLAAGFAPNAFAIEDEEWYRDERIDLCSGEVTEILANEPGLRLRDGTEMRWERLILATGSTPVVPPGVEGVLGPGTHVVRTAAEVEALRESLPEVERVLVIGNGILGVEVAEQVQKAGRHAVLIGSRTLPLERQLNHTLAEILATRLDENGVELHGGERISSVRRVDSKNGDPGSPGFEVQTSTGEVHGDLIVFCTGVLPARSLAQSAGIAVNRGILVDEHLATSRANVYAAGDVAEHAGGYVSHLWHAAELQGELAGANAAGDTLSHTCPPFRMKCEVFGEYFFSMNVPSSTDGLTVTEEQEGVRYRSLYFANGRLRAAVMLNDKENAKTYVKAVREGWTPEEVTERLPLAASADTPLGK